MTVEQTRTKLSEAQALSVAAESADIFRGLLAAGAPVEQQAATAYGVFSDLLDQVRRPEEALTVMLEALALRRWLYDTHGSLSAALDLLGALGSMDDRLMDFDRPADVRAVIEVRAQQSAVAALSCSDAAVQLYRELAKQYLNSYHKELAASLTDHAARLSAAGRKVGGLQGRPRGQTDDEQKQLSRRSATQDDRCMTGATRSA